MLGSDINLVVARLLTSTTSLGAGSPGVPGVLAVDGARVSVAVLLGDKCPGRCTTEGSCVDNRSGAALDTATAKLGARTPGTPAGYLAVDGARKGVASLVFLGVGAAHTTVGVGVDDGTSTFLGTRTAGCSASAEGSPGSYLAVNGASEGVASLDAGSDRAGNAAVGIRVHYRTRALLGARAAGSRAGRESRPA